MEDSTGATHGTVPRWRRSAGREEAGSDRGRSGDGDDAGYAGGCTDGSSGAAHRVEAVRAVGTMSVRLTWRNPRDSSIMGYEISRRPGDSVTDFAVIVERYGQQGDFL